MKAIKGLLLPVLAVSFLGCASIPPEVPHLSSEIGKRISTIEDSNITLLHRFFDQKRRDVDEFIREEWVPAFAEEVFSTELVKNAWDTIVRENDKTERLKLLVRLGPRLQVRIDQKRNELMKPLNELEELIENNIRREYSQVRAMNASVTSFLLSAAKVAENRNRLLESAGVTQSQVDELVNQTDVAVASLLGSSQLVLDKVERGEQFIEKIKSLNDSIK